MNPQDTIRALAQHVKDAVVPHLGTWRARRVTGIASSGDATFDIDDIAEGAVAAFVRDRRLNVGCYSEDKGLVPPPGGGTPDGVLIIDPIDGTRGAIAGFEACVVSVAWCDYSETPRLRDVRYAAVTELKSPFTLSAVRGEGVEIRGSDGADVPILLAPTQRISDMAWSLEVVGAPVELLLAVLKDLADATTVRGGMFVLNSSAYELTRLVTGQLAGVVDVRNRLLKEMPETRELFLRHGGGRLLCLYGYDLAAAALIAQEAGCIVTDAWGHDLSDWPLMDTSEGNFGSLIAASNPVLHASLMEAVNAGFAALAAAAR